MSSKVMAVCLAGALVTGCTRVNVAVDQPKTTGVPELSAGAEAANRRIVEIDRLLSAPLSGRPGDADQRATLRAERAALAGSSNQQPFVPMQSAPLREQTQPVAPATQNRQIVVAADSQGDHSPRSMSALEAMTPSERARYYKDQQIKHRSSLVVPVYVR